MSSQTGSINRGYESRTVLRETMILEISYDSVDLNERIFVIASNTGSILATFLISEARDNGAPQKRVILTQHEPSPLDGV